MMICVGRYGRIQRNTLTYNYMFDIANEGMHDNSILRVCSMYVMCES